MPEMRGSEARPPLASSSPELTHQIAQLERALRKAVPTTPTADNGREVRFAPEWVVNHREKVGLTQGEYGRLVGVSGGALGTPRLWRAAPPGRSLARCGS